MKSVWRLQHVNHRCNCCNLRLVMHIGQDGNVQFALDLGQDFQPALQARPAKAGAAAAVGLVEAALEDEGNAQCAGHFLQPTGHVHLQLFTFDHARPGDQEERSVQADIESAKLQFNSLVSIKPGWKGADGRVRPSRSC